MSFKTLEPMGVIVKQTYQMHGVILDSHSTEKLVFEGENFQCIRVVYVKEGLDFR